MSISPTSRTPPWAAQLASPSSPTHADVINTLEREREDERQAWHEQVVKAEMMQRGFNDAQEIWDRERMRLVERIASVEKAGALSKSQRHRMEEEVSNLRFGLKAAKRHAQSLARQLATSENKLAAAKDDLATFERDHRTAVEVFAAREAEFKAETIEKNNFQQEIASARGEEIIQLSSEVWRLKSDHCQLYHEADEHVRRERAEAEERVNNMRLEYEAECSESRNAMILASRKLQVADECLQALHEVEQLANRAADENSDADENSARHRRVRFRLPGSFKSGRQIEHVLSQAQTLPQRLQWLLIQSVLKQMVDAEVCPERVKPPSDRINEWQTQRPDTSVPSWHQKELVLDSMTRQPTGEPNDRFQTSCTQPSSTGCLRKTQQSEYPLEKRNNASSSKDHQRKFSSASSGKHEEPLLEQQRKLGQMYGLLELLHQLRERQARPPSTDHTHILGASDQVVEHPIVASTVDNIEAPAVWEGHHAVYREWHRRKNPPLEHSSVYDIRELRRRDPEQIQAEQTSLSNEACNPYALVEGSGLDLEEGFRCLDLKEGRSQTISTKSPPDFESWTERVEFSEPETGSAWPFLRAASDGQAEDFIERQIHLSL